MGIMSSALQTMIYFLHLVTVLSSRSRRMVDRTVAAATVVWTQAPPAVVFRHPPQCQIPTACLLTVSFPQNPQVNLACWVISIFFTCFRSEAPYLVPYFPTIPTFFVLLAYHRVRWFIFRWKVCDDEGCVCFCFH
eukprot:TRINITY_DN6673_c1_g1_i2.p1 TRINITY_DN6673_c1_g1~~TRINITY_DN6673_c1_g1_i2.p1  ORF type:complete len:135 (+),score=0.99 TRINITY_DN6673_c1_g1_i2:351-755(+)